MHQYERQVSGQPEFEPALGGQVIECDRLITGQVRDLQVGMGAVPRAEVVTVRIDLVAGQSNVIRVGDIESGISKAVPRWTP